MYMKFNLDTDGLEAFLEKQTASPLSKTLQDYKFHKELSDHISQGIIDASELAEDWFTPIEADIFLSHSHADEDLALRFGGWLESFGLKVFIDSRVWNYADELLKDLDNRYCLNNGGKTYNYKYRNVSTAHVHMLLAMALAKEIDRSHCLIFLNTPQSVSMRDDQRSQTFSSWIAMEIAMSNLIRKRNEPVGIALESTDFSKQKIPLVHDLKLDDFPPLTVDDFDKPFMTSRGSLRRILMETFGDQGNPFMKHLYSLFCERAPEKRES